MRYVRLPVLGLLALVASIGLAGSDTAYGATFSPTANAAGTPEQGAECSNNQDDDGDGKVNDGCPASADGNPETGAQCDNSDDATTATRCSTMAVP